MAGHRCVDVFLAVQANGHRRFECMVAERGLAGRILAVIAVLVAGQFQRWRAKEHACPLGVLFGLGDKGGMRSNQRK